MWAWLLSLAGLARRAWQRLRPATRLGGLTPQPDPDSQTPESTIAPVSHEPSSEAAHTAHGTLLPEDEASPHATALPRARSPHSPRSIHEAPAHVLRPASPEALPLARRASPHSPHQMRSHNPLCSVQETHEASHSVTTPLAEPLETPPSAPLVPPNATRQQDNTSHDAAAAAEPEFRGERDASPHAAEQRHSRGHEDSAPTPGDSWPALPEHDETPTESAIQPFTAEPWPDGHRPEEGAEGQRRFSLRWPENGPGRYAASPWPELLDDSALWAQAPDRADERRIRRLDQEQEGKRWNG